MGTRSLLAVETERGKYHVQYMQFDGYPSVKGYEYYTAILNAVLQVGINNLTTPKGNPNKLFRQRCLDFLNNYQYLTYHSTNNHFEIKRSEWTKQDCWQEWQYVFRYNGDFEFFSTYSDKPDPIVIPWGLTKRIGQAFTSPLDFWQENRGNDENPDIFQLYFNAMDDYNAKTHPQLILEFGEVQAFEGKHGWRDYATLKMVKGRKTLDKAESLFAPKTGAKRKQDKISVKI